MGIYGLTQAVLQLPFGMASDRLGRKRVIVFGLLLFAAGSLLAAAGDQSERADPWAQPAGRRRRVGRRDGLAGGPDARRGAHQGHGAGGRQHRADVCAVAGARARAGGRHRVAGAVRADRRAGAGRCGHGGLGRAARAGGAQESAARQVVGGAAPSRPAAAEFWRVRAACGATGHVDGRAGPAGAGRAVERPSLVGVPAGGAGVVLRHGRHAVPAGAPWLPARGVPGGHRPDRAGAAGPAGDGLGPRRRSLHWGC